jgi:hypothetical protein
VDSRIRQWLVDHGSIYQASCTTPRIGSAAAAGRASSDKETLRRLRIEQNGIVLTVLIERVEVRVDEVDLAAADMAPVHRTWQYPHQGAARIRGDTYSASPTSSGWSLLR